MHLNLTPANPVRGKSAGFTLIELMLSITLFAILTLLAMPVYSTFIANTQIRTATESMLSGLRLAQAEAVKRNGDVEFVLDEAVGWKVNELVDNVPVLLQQSEFNDGASKTLVQPSGASRRVIFNGLGRIATKIPPVPMLGQIDITTSTSISSPRNLRVVIGSAYGMKACDVALPKTDPGGCP